MPLGASVAKCSICANWGAENETANALDSPRSRRNTGVLPERPRCGHVMYRLRPTRLQREELVLLLPTSGRCRQLGRVMLKAVCTSRRTKRFETRRHPHTPFQDEREVFPHSAKKKRPRGEKTTPPSRRGPATQARCRSPAFESQLQFDIVRSGPHW